MTMQGVLKEVSANLFELQADPSGSGAIDLRRVWRVGLGRLKTTSWRYARISTGGRDDGKENTSKLPIPDEILDRPLLL